LTNPDFNKILHEALERQKEENHMHDYQARELITTLKQISKSLKEISRNLNHIAFPDGEVTEEVVDERLSKIEEDIKDLSRQIHPQL
jgi:hypothetical protein